MWCRHCNTGKISDEGKNDPPRRGAADEPAKQSRLYIDRHEKQEVAELVGRRRSRRMCSKFPKGQKMKRAHGYESTVMTIAALETPHTAISGNQDTI